nr:hypothetical protein [Tanacetum cinerariifolium]
MLLMALPNVHLLTFSHQKDAKTLFEAIQARFCGNDATKKTQRSLLKQMYENFNAPSTESFDSIFNRNKIDIDTMSIDDLYNNFKIVKQEVKRTAVLSSSSRSPNMAFLSSLGSTNVVDTTSIQVSVVSTPVSTISSPDNTANLSDATVYGFLANQPNGSQLVHKDLEQIHEDDLEEMDLKWQLALLSIRARRYFQKTGKKITINGSDTAGYDKTKVECFNCHKMGHFTWEYRSHRNQESRPRNQDGSRKTVIMEDTSSKAMMIIDGAGFDWSYMADDEVPTNMALMDFSDSEHPEFKGYRPKASKSVSVDTSNVIKKDPDALIIKDCVSDSDENEYEEMMVQKLVLKNVEKGTVQREVRPVWNNAMRTNHQNFANSIRNFAPTAVLTKSGIVPISTVRRSSLRAAAPVSAARPINTVVSKPIVNVAKPRKNALQTTHSLSRRPFYQQTTFKNRNLNNSFNAAKANSINTAKENKVTSVVGNQGINAVKSSACWVWRPKIKVQDHVFKNSRSYICKRFDYGTPQDALKYLGYFDSGCSRHMTGNISYLTDFKEHNGGFVAFWGGAKGGKITGKDTIRTDLLGYSS